MTVEEYITSDEESLYSVFKEWNLPEDISQKDFHESLERMQNEPFNKAFVAKENGRVLGYVQVFRILELGMPVAFEVSELIVSKIERSKGIGAKLLKKAEEYAKAGGASSIKLSSQLFRSRAHVFYENNGYQCVKMSKFYKKAF